MYALKTFSNSTFGKEFSLWKKIYIKIAVLEANFGLVP